MQEDKFGSELPSITGPATSHFEITPSDTQDLTILPRVIYCQVDGDIVILDSAGVALPYAMVAGDRLDFRGVRVMETGTTGTFYGWS